MVTAANPAPCSAAGCVKPAKTRGMCGMHAERVRNHGTTDLLDGTLCYTPGCNRKRTTRWRCDDHIDKTWTHPNRAVFESRFTPGDAGECWKWQGAVSTEGYGRLSNEYAHRLSFEKYVGPIPDGLQVDHLCHNRKCVNPRHLELVTPRVNMIRGTSTGALAVQMNRCMRGHELTPENTYIPPQGGTRVCRICIRRRSAELTARRASARGAA